MPSPKGIYLPMARQHVRKGAEWGHSAGTDYWLNFNSGLDILGAASTATGDELAENGWTATSLVNTAAAGSDFGGGLRTPLANQYGGVEGTYGDAGAPGHALTNASGDLLGSPAIFGDAAHMWQAARLLGRSDLPRYLIAEFWAAFTVASADEATSAIGFFEDGATISTEADQYAVIASNSANFELNGNAATMATGPAVATTWALWKIVLEHQGATGPKVYAYRNGTAFSTTPGTGAQDEFPLKFGFHALTTNRIGLGLTHIYYDY